MEHLIDQELYGEAVVKSLEIKFTAIAQEVSEVVVNTVNEIRNIINTEMKKISHSRDGSNPDNIRGSSPYNSN